MTKTIDVTLATIKNVGRFNASPIGPINGLIVRAVNDEEIHQSESLYFRRNRDEPMFPGGPTFIIPGDSSTFNVTRRLTITPDEALMFFQELTELEGQIYSPSRRKVRFDEIDGFNTVSCDYSVISGGEFILKIIATYTINLARDDRSEDRSKTTT
jgi:hypothetical protein